MTSNTATAAQISLINTLKAEKDIYTGNGLGEDLLRMGRAAWDEGLFTVEVASTLIDGMLKLPRLITPAVVANAPEPEAGLYRLANDWTVRVYYGQRRGCMLAKRVEVTDGELNYTYAGRAASLFVRIGGAEKLTIQEAGALGKATGTCAVCGRRLDDPQSVDRGLGARCASRF